MKEQRLSLSEFVDAARGLIPADVVFKNARVVNVLTGEVHEESVGVRGGTILGFGPYHGREEIDLGGRYLAPALWDAHLHIESTMTTPREFARLAMPCGTAAVVTDPHEIANVRGTEGLEDFLEDSSGLPLDILVMLPSCVPATHLETAGARLEAADLARFYGRKNVLGLAEMMNVPGFLFGDPVVRAKVEDALESGVPIDGHSPLLSGLDLNAYIGAGIRSDHECLSANEALEKARRGMSIWIREGTAAKNLDELLPLVTPQNSGCFAFATDDRHPWDLLSHGHVDHHVRRAISMGLDPVLAIRLASLSCARHYGFSRRGAIAPGYRADLIVFESLSNFEPDLVYLRGQLVARSGHLLEPVPARRMTEGPAFDIDGFDRSRLRVAATEGAVIRVIDIVPGNITTGARSVPALIHDGGAQADPDRDIAKLAVVERHHGTGNVGVGFASGFGLHRGAIASSVAHDSHNIVTLGCDDQSMETAIRRTAAIGGGIVIANGTSVLAEIPLPVAGLMSNEPIADVDHLERRANEAALSLGTRVSHPFMTLAFLALPVIPELKLTDRGLVDVSKFDFVPTVV